MVKLGSAIKNQVAMGQKENDIIKRNADYSLNAFITKDNKKNMRQASAKIKYAKDSLLDKIISSNLNENAINKRLEQISYSAINGQRQTEGTYKPEGVQMLGQLGREKPLEAITKEMIQQYQEDEQAKPYMVDGEARQYRGATYEPQFPVSFGELRQIDANDAAINEYQQKQSDIVTEMTRVDRQIQEKNNQIAALKDEINTKRVGVVGSIANFSILRTEMGNLKKLIQERKNLEKTNEQISYYLDIYKKNIEEAKRENAIINKQNREEVLKYEQSLKDANKNRLNLQQQPYESEYDYYQRLKEVEKEKFDPVLYKKYAENEETKKLKPNLDELFSDTSFKENVIKNINAEDKFMINRLFDKVGKAFLDEYGYNNTRLSPKMTAESLKRILNSVKGKEISPLQAAIQRNRQREIYSDTIALARDRQDLEARQAESAFNRDQQERFNRYVEGQEEEQDQEPNRVMQQMLRQRQARQAAQRQAEAEARRVVIAEAAESRRIAAATQRQNQRVEQSLNAARERRQRYAEQQVAADAAEAVAEGRQEAIARQQEIYNRQSQRETQYNARRAAEQQRQRSEQSLNAARERRQRYAEQQVAADSAATLRKERRITERQLLNQALAEGQQQNKEEKAARNIQRIFRGNEGRIKAALVRNQNRIKARDAALDELDRESFNRLTQRLSQNEKRIREEEKAARIIQQAQRNKKAINLFADLYAQREAEKVEQAKERLRQMESQTRSDLTARQRRIAWRFVDETPTRVLSQQEQEAIERLRANEELLKFQTAERDRNRQNKQATLIQSVLRGHKGRKQAQQQGQIQEPLYISTSPEVSPISQSMISAATTVAAEQMRAGLRKPRSDLGAERGPSKKTLNKELQKQLDSEFYETLTPDELNYFNSKKRMGGKTVTTILNEIRKKREGPKGAGIRKPPKRQVKINPEEKKKNRLQLVIAQIKAGNTNPKLILEVNKLYKSLYDIDNAYMMLK